MTLRDLPDAPLGQFNPSARGNARFTPIHDPSGSVIPAQYAATTPRGALIENVR